MKGSVISQILKQNCTSYYGRSNITVKVIIVNNTVLLEYDNSIEWLRIRTGKLKSQLDKIAKKTKIPDLYMLADMSDFMTYPDNNF